jgi:hypothetical protein
MQITKASGALVDAFAHGLHDLEVDAQQIVAAHARLAGHTGGHDDHVGTGDVGIVVRAGDLGVEAFNRAALRQVQSLALGDAIGDVEEDDVAQFLLRGQMGQRATDVASADQSDLLACHELRVLYASAGLPPWPRDWGRDEAVMIRASRAVPQARGGPWLDLEGALFLCA